MIRTIRSFALLCLTVLIAASIGVPAAMAANVTPWESVSFNSSTDPNSAVLIISGTLAENVPLPATVELAAPTGSTLQWAGEILGGDAANDPEVQATKTVRDGQDIYTFQITKSRTAQLEVATAAPVTISGSTYMVNFSVPAWTDMPIAGVAIQIPAMARLSEEPTPPAGLSPGPTGFQYYQQDFTSVKKGDVIGVSFAYTLGTGTGTAGAASPTGGSSLLIPMLLVGIAVAVGVALVVGVRRKLNANADYRDDRRDVRQAAPKRAKAEVQPVGESAFADDEGDAVDVVERTEVADQVAAPAAPRNNLALVGTLVIVGVLVAAGIVAATQGGKARTTGGVISKTFASGEACTNSTIQLAFPQGTDTAAAAEQLFTALATVPSVTVATIQVASPSISIGYCDSETNEAAIVQALTPTGYVVPGGATTSSSETSESIPATAPTN